MDMVEKVARAIYGGDWDSLPDEAWLPSHGSLQDGKAQYRFAARAAIEAMREPTEAMRIAALNSGLPEADDPPLYEMIWRNMIDAALTERPSDNR